MRCTASKRGFSQYFKHEDLNRIRSFDLDFILRFAFGIIRGEILRMPRYGVWSFHHDDLGKYRGGPPAFWEMYYGDRVTGAVLQRLTDRLDGGVVLRRGYVRTIKESYIQNRDQAFLSSAGWPAAVCRDIHRGNTAKLEAAPSSTSAPVYHDPRNWQTLRSLAQIGLARAKGKFDWYFRAEQWNVGIADVPISAFLAADRPLSVRWFPKLTRNLFRADPFGISDGPLTTVLVEEFDYRKGKGTIAAIRCGGSDQVEVLSPALDLPFHLSYPYLVQWDGQVYCIPETCQVREIGLYRAVHFPAKWEKVATLVEGVDAVDPTVFRHEGRWWLLCADGSVGARPLHAWYADHLAGPWRPHACNPLKGDVRSTRPGGTPFVHNGRLIRPTQDCSGGYGTAISLNHIRRLTPTEFEEEPIAVVTPMAKGPYPDGVHTLSAMGEKTLIDGKRMVFIPAVFWRNVAATVKAFWSRLVT